MKGGVVEADAPILARTFVTTRWTVVLSARDNDSTTKAEALAKLCETYWYPLYAYVRRRGYAPPAAQDLTQEFFAQLLEKDFLRAVDPTRGRFRSFLVMAIDRFLTKEWVRSHRLKRGGVPLVSLDAEAGERRYLAEPADNLTPERIFERRWALSLVERSVQRLREKCSTPEKRRLFDCVQGLLAGDREDAPYEGLASELGLTRNALKVAVHRLRQRHRALLREEVRETVGSAEEVDEEIRHLLSVLSA